MRASLCGLSQVLGVLGMGMPVSQEVEQKHKSLLVLFVGVVVE